MTNDVPDNCRSCGGSLNGISHSNGNLGSFSFTHFCDACQGAAWSAYRVAAANNSAATTKKFLAQGGTSARPPTNANPLGGS